MGIYSLSDLEGIIKTLDNSLPDKVPMTDFSTDIDLLRVIILRESIFCRVRELAKSALDLCQKDRLVSAILLTRGLMETEALFAYFLIKLERAIQSNEFDQLKKFLTDALRGARAEKKPSRPLSINVLKYIEHVDKNVPGYKDQYEFLSEFSHPNSSGLNKSYSKYDWESKEIIFGDNREKLSIDFVINQLGVSLECFIREYDRSAGLLDQWFSLTGDNSHEEELSNES